MYNFKKIPGIRVIYGAELEEAIRVGDAAHRTRAIELGAFYLKGGGKLPPAPSPYSRY